MWSAKISFDSKNLFAEFAKKYNVKLLVFPLSWHDEEGSRVVISSGVVFGEDLNKKMFFRNLRKHKVKDKFFGLSVKDNKILKKLEVSGDFFVAKSWESPLGKYTFNSNIVYTRPWLIEESGKQTVAVSAFEKRYLNDFISGFEKVVDVRVHYLRKGDVSNIAFRLSAPNLTERQKWAMDLAVSGGYYEIPRRVSVKELARRSGLSFATFHGHLRRAERVMMPFWFGK